MSNKVDIDHARTVHFGISKQAFIELQQSSIYSNYYQFTELFMDTEDAWFVHHGYWIKLRTMSNNDQQLALVKACCT